MIPDLPLQDFSIFIGKNNAGKTNALLAIKLLLEASARDVSEEDFYKTDTENSDTIELRGEFSVPEEYLSLCDEKHKGKIQNWIVSLWSVEGCKLGANT
jgi:recombinational DNA repair ATPase RecF